MKKIISFCFLVLFSNLIIVSKASAMCPVCTIAVGAGIGFSRWLGVDDLITGLWVGALTMSMILWTINWFNKKNIHFILRDLVTYVGYYLLVVVPLYFTGVIGYLNSYFLFLDKVTLGIIIGSFIFWIISVWYSYLKMKNGGHAHFPFQKVVMPVGTILVLSFVIYFLLKI